MKNKTIMVIAAHPDDPEFAFGGTVAKWIKEGARAIYILCTKGNRGGSNLGVSPEKLTLIRQKEQRAAAKIIGVSSGEAVLDAVYPLARDLLSFPGHSEEGLTPHKVTEVYLANFEDPDFFVDVSETAEIKIKAIMAHKSQVETRQNLGEFIRERLAETGKACGYKFAESFRRLQLTP